MRNPGNGNYCHSILVAVTSECRVKKGLSVKTGTGTLANGAKRSV